MKSTTPILSPEQKRAKNQYQIAIVPIGLTIFVFFILVEVLALIILNRLNISIDSSGSLIFLPFMFGAFLLAHILSVRKVRSSGLSLESKKVEVVFHMENNYHGEPMEWGRKTLRVSFGNASAYFFISAVGWLGSGSASGEFLWFGELSDVLFGFTDVVDDEEVSDEAQVPEMALRKGKGFSHQSGHALAHGEVEAFDVVGFSSLLGTGALAQARCCSFGMTLE